MHLSGVALSTLFPLGAVAAGLVVLAYVLKLRRRAVPVPFARLWQRILREQEATSLFSQLKRIISLLVQLALLGLLLAALGDPRPTSALQRGRSVVVLVDASASMQAADVAPSRLEQARTKLRELIGGLGGADQALVAQMDATVTPLSTLTTDTAELQAAASAIHRSDAPADFSRALRFALDAIRGVERPEIVVISDGKLGEARDGYGDVHLGQVPLHFISVGNSGRNAAITQFSVRRYPLDKSRYEVMTELSNTSGDPLDVQLTLYGDGNVVDMSTLRLAPHEQLSRYYPNLSGANRQLEASISLPGGQHDDLGIDDHAYALLPERRRSRVLCVTSGNTYLEAALLLDEYLEVTTVPPSGYATASGNFDVTIFDSVAPPLTPNSGASFYINPSGPDSPVATKGAVTDVGFDTWDKKSPLLRWAAIDDVNIGRANKFVPEKEDKIVGASFQTPLLVTGRRGSRRFAAMAFDLRDSDMPLRISWPLILLNTINDFTHEDTSYVSSFRTGDVWRIPVSHDARDAELLTPDGTVTRVPVVQGYAVFLGQTAGFYTLRAAASGSATGEERSFAANLSDLQESSIAPVQTVTAGGATSAPPLPFQAGMRREIWIYLLIAAVAISVIEWLTYHRRITV